MIEDNLIMLTELQPGTDWTFNNNNTGQPPQTGEEEENWAVLTVVWCGALNKNYNDRIKLSTISYLILLKQ